MAIPTCIRRPNVSVGNEICPPSPFSICFNFYLPIHPQFLFAANLGPYRLFFYPLNTTLPRPPITFLFASGSPARTGPSNLPPTPSFNIFPWRIPPPSPRTTTQQAPSKCRHLPSKPLPLPHHHPQTSPHSMTNSLNSPAAQTRPSHTPCKGPILRYVHGVFGIIGRER